jgi:glucose/arabinose dehydrogenase
MRIPPLKAVLPCCVAALALACGGSSSDSQAPSQPGASSGPKLAWDQFAPSTEDLRQYSYVLYVDGAPVPLTAASCGALAAETLTAACTAPLPALAPGQHTLAMATRITRDGIILESGRSAPISYTVGSGGFASGTAGVPAAAPSTGAAVTGPAGSGSLVARDPGGGVGSPGASFGAEEVLGAGGDRFLVEIVASDLDRPSALARFPDGRLLIAEQGGRLRFADEGLPLLEPAALLPGADPADDARVSIALAPDFESSRHVYVAYAAVDDRGARSGRILRFREAGGVLGEAAVLVDGLPAAVAAPWVAIGPDRTLYVGTSALDAEEALDLGSDAGKILRFALDGTIAAGNPVPSSPVFSFGFVRHSGLDADPGTGDLWFVEETSAGTKVGRAQAGRPAERLTDLGLVRAGGLTFHSGESPAGWQGSLFVPLPDERCLLHVSGLDASPPAPTVERVLSRQFGRIATVIAAADGLYFATQNGDSSGAGHAVDFVYRVRDNARKKP